MKLAQLAKRFTLITKSLGKAFTVVQPNPSSTASPLANIGDYQAALENQSKKDYPKSLYHFLQVRDILEHSNQRASAEYLQILKQYSNQHGSDQL
jgi:hypothetical protein